VLATTERLARALEAKGDPRLRLLVERARQGYYDDYKSELDFPLNQLVADLNEIGGHSDLVQRAIHGDFDATREEAREWANTPEGREAFRELGR
jgi:hypothetical protein